MTQQALHLLRELADGLRCPRRTAVGNGLATSATTVPDAAPDVNSADVEDRGAVQPTDR